MAPVAIRSEEIEQQATERVMTDQRVLRSTGWLPTSRIVFVPFSLVEVELLPEDE